MATRSGRTRKTQQAAQQPENQSRAKWTASLTKTLADLMVDEIRRGYKSNKSFSKKGWKLICDNFRLQTGYWWDNEQLKSRHAALRKQYVNVAMLLDDPDFEWDETTGAIVATDEAWDRYIKEHPDAETLRSTGCPIYKQLLEIFAPEADECQKQQTGLTAKENEGINDLSVKVEELSPSEAEKYGGGDMGNRNKRGRRGIEDGIAKGILEMASAIKLRTEATLNKFNGKYSITDCIRALDTLEGINDKVYFAALELFNNRDARETFLSLKHEKRLIWLQGKCG